MDPAKLKVVELRSQLGKRGLDTKGNKAVLVERLRKALEDETGDQVEESVPTDLHNENSGDPSSQDEREKTPEPTKIVSPTKSAGRSPRSSSGGSPTKVTPTRGSPKIPTTPIIQKQLSPAKSPIVEEAPEPLVDKLSETPTETNLVIEQDKNNEPEQSVIPESKVVEPISEQTVEPVEISTPQVVEDAPEIKSTQDESVNQSESVCESIEANVSESSSEIEDKQEKEELTAVDKENVDINDDISEEDAGDKEEINDEHIEDSNEQHIDKPVDAAVTDAKMDIDEKYEEDYDDKDKKSDSPSEESGGDGNSLDNKNEIEMTTDIKEDEVQTDKVKNDIKSENTLQETDLQDVDMKQIKQEQDVDKDSKDQDRRDRKERKRKRSTSSQDDRHKSPPPSKMDDEPEIDYSRVLLSWYDSDLNLVIDKSKFLSATPMHTDGFGYVWAGARASFGFITGKVYYEVKITHQCTVTLEGEEYPHVLRAGWSVASTSMQLGEEKLSYGYGGTGKISTGNNFKDYGKQFGLNDILGCYLDMSDDNIVISYTLNGENLGEAFKITKDELENKALYPHILTKNCEFVCNFGDEAPWNENILEGYTPVGQVDLKDRVPGPQRPEKREECEMIMLVGLPAAGKTVWANNYAAENREKLYNILGTNNLVDKMKVVGLPRKRNYHGRWEVLIDKCSRCLNKLLEVAATRRRNYILDQAIVIVPTEEEFKSRTAKREATEGKDIPDSAVLEMKANFSAPVVGESFDSVEWIELDEEEAKKLIAKYNKEGKDAGYNQQQTSKRPRFENRSDSHRDSRDIRSSRNSRDSRDHRDRRSAYSDRNRNSTWRGGNHMSGGSGGSGGGWRDRAPRGSGAHMRHSSGGYGGSSGGWRGGRGGQSLTPSHRGSDRRGSSNDRRSAITDSRSRSVVSRQGGGWGPMNSNYHNSGHSSSGWGSSGGSGGGQSSGNWSSQSQQGSYGGGNSSSGSWGQQQNWGNWKGYGQSNYNQSNYNQQGYGNGNWGGWNQQYYNQYWGGQQQSSQSGQSTGSSGQSAITSSGVSATPTASTTSASSTYNSYPQAGWQGYTQSYYSADSSNTSTPQQK
ncbi:hypothetical protein PV326_002641 [Microctonus aethiopoides]|nr:hypothetical protein PV326_002641 [Microctonus aethiopoides]